MRPRRPSLLLAMSCMMSVGPVPVEHLVTVGRLSPRTSPCHKSFISYIPAGRPGPALGEQDLRISDEKSQTRTAVPFSRAADGAVQPQVHGWTELVERRPTIYLRAENSNVAEQEGYIKVTFCRSRCDTAEEHGDGRCASPSNLPRTPAPSVPGVTASQASSGVDLQPRSASSSTTR